MMKRMSWKLPLVSIRRHPVRSALCAVLGLVTSAQAQVPAVAVETGQTVYQATCAACHDAGVAGAPRKGDRKRWARLQREGQVRVTAHGWVGEGAMPAKGGRADLSLEHFAAAVVHMANESGVNWSLPGVQALARIQAEARRKAASKHAPGAKQ